MNKFIPGIELNRGFYEDVVKGIIKKEYPELVYSVGLIGFGSDVLGCDTPVSMDHMWGPRLIIFVSKEDNKAKAREIEALLKVKLPYEYKGFSTNYSNPDHEGVSVMEKINNGPIRHLIWVTDVEGFVNRAIGFEWSGELTMLEWLSISDQALIELTRGEIYYDGLNTLGVMRKFFEQYPKDIRRIRLAALWKSVAEEVAFVGRNRDLGDLTSVKLISSRLVNTLMKMCFYIEGKYIPYSKWFGHEFSQLDCYEEMKQIFEVILFENEPKTIELKLAQAYKTVLKMQNSSGLTPQIEGEVSDYFGRPYAVMFVDQIIEGLVHSVSDQRLKKINLDDLSIITNSNGVNTSHGWKWVSDLEDE